MKKFLSVTLWALAVLTATAQTHMRIWQNGEDNRIKIANAGDMTFRNGKITIKDKEYVLSSIDSLIIVPEITVNYQGSTATVHIPEAVADRVTATTDGAHVTITNTDASNEVELILSGTSSDGSFTYNGIYKCSIQLNGLSLTSKRGAAMDIECGKRIELNLADGTQNTLTDAADGTQKACLYCKGHLEMEGGGSLAITANAKHGISTKEYLQLKRSLGTLTFVKSAKDAIHAGQYFQMNGGTLTIDENTLGDGIDVETLLLDDDKTPDPEEENNGQVIIKGGTLTMNITQQDSKGIKCDSLISIYGGSITIEANGNGTRGIQTDGNMIIAETDATTAPTVINIAAKGGVCTLAADAADPHRCMGIKADGKLTVSGGNTTVTNTGKKSRGIKVGSYNKEGGTVNASITYAN